MRYIIFAVVLVLSLAPPPDPRIPNEVETLLTSLKIHLSLAAQHIEAAAADTERLKSLEVSKGE